MERTVNIQATAKNGLVAMSMRERAEISLINVRWVLLAAATLYLLFSSNVCRPLWGWMAVFLGVLSNMFFILGNTNPFPMSLSIAAQASDTVILEMYTAALNGGMTHYLPLYTILIIIAVIRFGTWGAVWSGIVGVAVGLVAPLISPSGDAPTAEVVMLSFIADVALLTYMAYLTEQQQLAHRHDEAMLRKRISEITALHEVSSAVHDLKSEDALQNIVKIVTNVMGFRRAALFLTDDLGETIPTRYYSPPPSRNGHNPPIAMDPSLFTAILEREEPIIIDGSQGLADMERGPILQVAVPLHSDRSPIGVLVADRGDRQPIPSSDMEMLASLAKSAVVAIENASLHRRVKHMANHDGVTDLYNHRYFQEQLRSMIAKSGGRWPISLLMIEIDKFKRYNDTYGHRQGDAVLFALSRALEKSTRRWNGLVARYGGDEFVVILPRVGRNESLRVTKTIRDDVYRLMDESLARYKLPPVTLSIGVATYPDDARTAGDLIEAADQAMYVVKHSGGDRVHAFRSQRFA